LCGLLNLDLISDKADKNSDLVDIITTIRDTVCYVHKVQL